LLAQTKPVQRVVAVDTGSRDRSGAVLTAKLGQAAVFGMDRSTGYAAAVRRALQHKAATAPVAASQPGGGRSGQGRGRSEQVEWIWLLHDDCEPAPDALEQLLRGAAETPAAAVLGPKLKDWAHRDVILEAGLSLDSVGRRITGVEPHEIDQGQHDGDRDALAVSSAGMLVRRDVWDQVGGFDPSMTLFGEDIDLCWRVHGAGLRVRVITDAVVYHAMAATRRRRPISVGRRARLLERRHSLQTLLGNLPTGPMIASLVANLTISVLRTVFYMVAKRGTAALDETAAVAAVFGHPIRFARARSRRARGRRAAYGRVRADLPPGHSIRRAAEFLALVLTRSAAKPEPAAGHSAIDDPTDDDSLLIDTGFVQRFVTRPGVLLTFGLIIVAAVAERSLIGGGPLGGGALAPAWEGSSQLWREVLQAFHPSGIGSASAAPPYAGFVALLATILLGKVWLAVDVLLLGAVPLAGITALLAMRRVISSARIRVWAAASYALLPVAFGAVAAGRLGSAVAFTLIPLIGLLAGRMFSEPPRLARRAAWATGLTVTVGTAFAPVLWPMAVVAAVIATLCLRRSRAMLLNLGIVAATPPVLLLPWMTQLLAHPSGLLLEAGVQQPGLTTPDLPARSLLLLSPGGPGLPPYWVSAALLLTALVALLAIRRRVVVVAGWTTALLGFVTAVAASRVVVTPAGGQQMTPWPGPALAVAAAGLILAGAVGAEGLGRRLPGRGRKAARPSSARTTGVALLWLAAVSAPLLAAGYWLWHGVTGPVTQSSGQVVPALVTPAGGAGRQLRTLVLASDQGHVSYLLLRGDSPNLTDSGLVPVADAQTALSKAVAALVAPGGDQAASQSQLLANFDIGFVLMRAPTSPQLVSLLDQVPGLSQVSMTATFDLWKLAAAPARVSVVAPNGVVVALSSGPISVSGAAAPPAGGTLELAEPAGGWQATLNGHALTAIPSPAGSWAQAFRLPPGGGTVSIVRAGLIHDVIAAIELLAFVVVAALALPGVRTAAELEAAGAANAGQAQAPAEEQPTAVAASGEENAAEPDRPRSPRRTPVGRQGRAGHGGRAAGGRTTAGRGRQSAGRGQGSSSDGEDAAQPRARRGASRLLRSSPGDGGADRPRRESDQAERPEGAEAGRPGATAARAARAAASQIAGAAGAGAAAGGAAARAAGRAAWPGGQRTSRFPSDSPTSDSYRSDSGDHSGPQARPGRRDSRSRTAPSPSGTRYDELRGDSQAEQPRGYPPQSAWPRSPSGMPYRDEPADPPRRRDGSGRSREPQHRASSWPESSRQRGWPEEGEALEALPPNAEVHHDWPAREGRHHRGWTAPEDDGDGDTW